jgi:hypothetical protein
VDLCPKPSDRKILDCALQYLCSQVVVAGETFYLWNVSPAPGQTREALLISSQLPPPDVSFGWVKLRSVACESIEIDCFDEHDQIWALTAELKVSLKRGFVTTDKTQFHRVEWATEKRTYFVFIKQDEQGELYIHDCNSLEEMLGTDSADSAYGENSGGNRRAAGR